MGFDLIGVNGNRFHATSWSWVAIVDAIAKTGALSEDALNAISYNDGDFITEGQAIRIAEVIEHFAKEGFERAILPGSLRVHAKGSASGGDKFCDKPDCSEEHRSPYWVESAQLLDFIRFCRESGGFEVW
jgi:hypothetical protein